MIKHENRYKRLLLKIQDGVCDVCKKELPMPKAELKPRPTPRDGNIVFLKHAMIVHKDCVNG